MTLSTTWEKVETPYSPPDNRFWQILEMVNGFQHYFYNQAKATQNTPENTHPSQITITGSTAWLWQRLSSSTSQSHTNYIQYCLFGMSTDIDLRNLVQVQKENASILFYREYIALYDLAVRNYHGFYHPPNLDTDYAQITFTSGKREPRKLDWTITTISKAPMHNFDIFCVIKNKKEKTIQFNLPSFENAKQTRNNNQFLLNPAIFQINNEIPSINYDELEDVTIHKASNPSKTLASILKAICKISMTGVSLGDYTQTYLNTLAKTPSTPEFAQYAYNQNHSMLQTILSSFYHVYYKTALPDDKYIYETALAAIHVQLPENEKSLYQIFTETIKTTYYPYLEEEKFSHLVKTPINTLSLDLQKVLNNNELNPRINKTNFKDNHISVSHENVGNTTAKKSTLSVHAKSFQPKISTSAPTPVPTFTLETKIEATSQAQTTNSENKKSQTSEKSSVNTKNTMISMAPPEPTSQKVEQRNYALAVLKNTETPIPPPSYKTPINN